MNKANVKYVEEKQNREQEEHNEVNLTAAGMSARIGVVALLKGMGATCAKIAPNPWTLSLAVVLLAAAAALAVSGLPD